jgi:2-keto-4-pentenoate hydratase/2-oxohepta-3-ene-1,7-dioic acid hydratase in catechol pathway
MTIGVVMKLATWRTESAAPRLGVVLDEEIADLTASGEPALTSMLELMRAGDEGLAAARATVAAAPRTPLSRVRLLSPIPIPESLRDFLSFERHVVQALDARRIVDAAGAPDPEAEAERLRTHPRFQIPEVFYKQPIYYKGNRFACIGDEDDVIWPAFSNLLDYELEMAAWIGRTGRDIPKEEAASYIFGYSIFNDMTARDTQGVEMPGQLGPAKSKDFDTANVLGPWIVTADELDVSDVAMIARINGQEVSRSSSKERLWSFEDAIAHVSASETIYPGEVFGSGTVGSGSGLERWDFLSPGDVIELEIEGIGTLRNQVVRNDR